MNTDKYMHTYIHVYNHAGASRNLLTAMMFRVEKGQEGAGEMARCGAIMYTIVVCPFIEPSSPSLSSRDHVHGGFNALRVGSDYTYLLTPPSRIITVTDTSMPAWSTTLLVARSVFAGVDGGVCVWVCVGDGGVCVFRGDGICAILYSLADSTTYRRTRHTQP